MNKCSILSLLACLASFEASALIYSGINLGINTVTVKKHLIYPLDGEGETPTSSQFSNAYTNFHAPFLAGYALKLQISNCFIRNFLQNNKHIKQYIL